MYESSDELYKRQQWFNANYLAGYVLECYCKLVLIMSRQQGYVFSNNRQSVRNFGHEISSLQDEVQLISMVGCGVSGYCINIQDLCSNLLCNWNPNKRYEADSHVLNSKTLADKIHIEIETLMNTIIQMEIDGVYNDSF